MSFPTTIPKAVLDTILNRLALLFLIGAAADPIAARQAAAQMLAAYNAETPDELCLAGAIVSFSFHTLEALAHASAPDLSLNKVLRLRGSAVSLSRESHKAQRKLDQLQRARRAGLQPPAEAQPTPASPKIDNALSLIEAVRDPMPASVETGRKISWSQSFQKRETARRMTENLKKNQALHASQVARLNAETTNAQTVPPAA
jgi:hypothetical protein